MTPPDGCCTHAQVEAFASEEELLGAFVDIVRALDPDIIIGYDVQKVIQVAVSEPTAEHLAALSFTLCVVPEHSETACAFLQCLLIAGPLTVPRQGVKRPACVSSSCRSLR